MDQFIIMNDKDNVAVVMAPVLAKGTDISANGVSFTVKDDIPFAHKIAINHISKGDRIYKYGEAVGIATVAISPGEHVHVHNVISGRHTVR